MFAINQSCVVLQMLSNVEFLIIKDHHEYKVLVLVNKQPSFDEEQQFDFKSHNCLISEPALGMGRRRKNSPIPSHLYFASVLSMLYTRR